MTHTDPLALAERYFEAMTSGDAEAVRACYAPEAEIWYNTDGKVRTVDQAVRTFEWFQRKLPERRYQILSRDAFPGGFVRRYVPEAQTPTAPLKISVCH
jgi:ketosteroid isomerase-like protein